jgi:hypothetical protein
MEDVLAVYQRPYTEKQPVVCLDETNRQLIGETKTPLPVQPGQPAVYGYEYVRNGTAGLFMLFEPHAGRREVWVNETRTKIDFAHCLRELAETHYPEAEKIVLVMDNLNTHTLASLYEAVPPEQARKLWERFEVHHTERAGEQNQKRRRIQAAQTLQIVKRPYNNMTGKALRNAASYVLGGFSMPCYLSPGL